MSTASSPAAAQPALEIEGLTKSFPDPAGGSRLVVDVPRLRLEAGAAVALEGGSGAGKTTLLHLVAGILRADTGRVTVAGEEMTALDEAGRDRLRARRIGYVFQTFNLLQGLSAFENVVLATALNGSADEPRARALLDRVSLSHRLHDRPRQLSAGQQQRVAVARALANRPALVLADEPTGNLDRANGEAALALLRDACRESGAALLLVSHDPVVLASFPDRLDFPSINRAGAAAGPA
ncbi:MAG: ABC transporter ATP-binding protein [Vicinamibacteria bacterium]